MKKFIIIHDQRHQVVSSLTRNTPLLPVQKGKVQNVYYDVSNIGSTLPDAYFFVTPHNSVDIQTINTLSPDGKREYAENRNYLDITNLDPRCFGTRRARIEPRGPGMLSLELINFGIGALRRKWDISNDLIHRVMRERKGTILVPGLTTRNIDSVIFDETANKPQHETWQSTNLIYGDLYGELTQILERKDDPKLMDAILRTLNQITLENAHLFYCTPNEIVPDPVVREHVQKDNIWQYAPKSRAELICRIGQILDNSTINTKPTTHYEKPSQTFLGLTNGTSSTKEIRNPDDGYDGWLQHPCQDD
jgi:hypothetical protein